MKRFSKTLTAVLFFSFFFIKAACASPLQIEYYGVVSSSSDINMLKMAQDFFYTQLNAIDRISVSDKRTDTSAVLTSIPDTSALPIHKLAFFVEINEDRKNETTVFWNCRYYAKFSESGEIAKREKVYDSYYKMLTNAKETIEDFLAPYMAKNERQQDAAGSGTEGTFPDKISLENLSGTWTGEPFTDKIVILRGGRGFIIFKNGATMNISVSLQETDTGSQVKIKQAGKTNASFLPELPRELALKAAPTADPVEWKLFVKSADTLSGTKKTLIPDQNETSVQTKLLETTWHKK